MTPCRNPGQDRAELGRTAERAALLAALEAEALLAVLEAEALLAILATEALLAAKTRLLAGLMYFHTTSSLRVTSKMVPLVPEQISVLPLGSRSAPEMNGAKKSVFFFAA